MTVEDLTPWLNRVKKAKSRSEVFAILDEFRQGAWTDEQCSMMAKLYIRFIDGLVAGDEPEQQAPAAVAAQDTGPVWYEKM